MTKKNGPGNDPQIHCIDLPGESVQCWRSSDNIKIVLRKHRDIIFELRLDDKNVYTLESAISPFYNARDKTLISAHYNDPVSFKDGERMHVWVARDFKGALLLKAANRVIMEILPHELDRQEHDADPKAKPAPILIKLGYPQGEPIANIPKQAAAVQSKSHTNVDPTPQLAVRAAAPIDEECGVTCVLDGKLNGIPSWVLKKASEGGGRSGLVDIDTTEVATRNWLVSQAAGSFGYIYDNWKWLLASIDGKTTQGIKLVSVKVSYLHGKMRFYFSGFSKYNNVFGRGAFGSGNNHIVTILGGAGSTSSTFKSVMAGIKGSFRGFAIGALLFGSALAWCEWKEDASKDTADFCAALLVSILKTIIVAALVAATVALLVLAIMAAAKIALPILVVGAVTIGLSFVMNYAVDATDKKLGKILTSNEKNSDGLSAALAPYIRTLFEEVSDSWNHLMKKFPADYKELYFERFALDQS